MQSVFYWQQFSPSIYIQLIKSFVIHPLNSTQLQEYAIAKMVLSQIANLILVFVLPKILWIFRAIASLVLHYSISIQVFLHARNVLKGMHTIDLQTPVWRQIALIINSLTPLLINVSVYLIFHTNSEETVLNVLKLIFTVQRITCVYNAETDQITINLIKHAIVINLKGIFGIVQLVFNVYILNISISVNSLAMFVPHKKYTISTHKIANNVLRCTLFLMEINVILVRINNFGIKHPKSVSLASLGLFLMQIKIDVNVKNKLLISLLRFALLVILLIFLIKHLKSVKTVPKANNLTRIWWNVSALQTLPLKLKLIVFPVTYQNTLIIRAKNAQIVKKTISMTWVDRGVLDALLISLCLLTIDAWHVLITNTSISQSKIARNAQVAETTIVVQTHVNVHQKLLSLPKQNALNATCLCTLILLKKSVYLALLIKFTILWDTSAKIVLMKSLFTMEKNVSNVTRMNIIIKA